MILVFDKNGVFLTELEAPSIRSWILNDEGTAVFSLPTSDPKCLPEYIKYGNLVFIPHESLPSWCGVIEEINWRPGTIRVRAFSPERFLNYFTAPQIEGTPGEIFEAMILQANSSLSLPINILVVDKIGIKWGHPPLGSSMFEYIRQMAGNEYEWGIYGHFSGGKLELYTKWVRYTKTDSAIPLIEDETLLVDGETLIEFGPVYNVVTFYGTVDSGNGKPRIQIEDSDSINLYGKREKVITAPAADAPTLERLAREFLAKYRKPQVRFSSVSIVDVNNIYKELAVGKRFPVVLKSMGFYGNSFGYRGIARILGLEYSDYTGIVKAELEVEEDE